MSGLNASRPGQGVGRPHCACWSGSGPRRGVTWLLGWAFAVVGGPWQLCALWWVGR